MTNPLAVTNLAWPAGEDAAGFALLRELGARGVEIAPAHSLGPWDAGVMDRANRLRAVIDAHGLRIPAIQGWLFGVEGVSLFGPESERTALARHLERVAELAQRLGARACVWGAPRSRDPGDLRPAEAFAVAVRFLRSIGDAFAARDTVLAFEANARRYGCRFVTRTEEAIALVLEAATKGIGLQLDIGTLILNAEPASVIADALPVATHVHVSEPDLAPIGTMGSDHPAYAAALRRAGWSGWISVEMKAAPDWRAALTSAFGVVSAQYGAA